MLNLGYEKSEEKFDELDYEIRGEVLSWIKDNLIQNKTTYREYNSYGLKHMVQMDIGIYLTNAQFKDAMIKAGFYPMNETAKNHNYCISRKSPAIRRFRKKI